MHDTVFWERAWQDAGGFWRHRGDPRLPHAELTSGKHSDGYANASVVVCRPELLSPMCAEMHETIALREAPDRIVGTAYGSIPFAYELATALRCKYGFTERPGEGPCKLKRFEIKTGDRVLVVTDRTTEDRLLQLRETIAAVRAAGAELQPIIGVICHRGNVTAVDEFQLASAAGSLRFWDEKTYNAMWWGSSIVQVDNPNVLERVCADLLRDLQMPIGPAWVIGCGIEAITLAYQLGKMLGCKAGFTEREMAKASPLTLARFDLKPREKILAVDDVITTGGTTEETIAAAETAQAEVIGHITAIANRSGKPKLGEREIVSLIAPQFRTWAPNDCELCRQGSKAIRPKGNWTLLTQASAS
ncbi:MAG: phosphoribosyltransferase family protein [Patescibacteria group bacterium]|nr:phosphoribosyltransferase family protein [Patescibacteria group bacterium]